MIRRRRECPITMPDTCSFPRWLLVAYDDGSLRGNERERTAAHLATCTSCRQWLVEMRVVDRLLRSDPVTPRIGDSSPARGRTTRLLWRRGSGLWQRPGAVRVAAVLAVLLVLVQGVFWRSFLVEGGSSFTHWQSDERFSGRVYPEAFATPVPGVLPSVVAESAPFPFDLRPIDDGADLAQLKGYRAYLRADGFAIVVGVDERFGSTIVRPEDPNDVMIIAVGGREVLLTFAETEIGRSIVEMDWIDGDLRHYVLVNVQPPGGITLEMARELAGALMQSAH